MLYTRCDAIASQLKSYPLDHTIGFYIFHLRAALQLLECEDLTIKSLIDISIIVLQCFRFSCSVITWVRRSSFSSLRATSRRRSQLGFFGATLKSTSCRAHRA